MSPERDYCFCEVGCVYLWATINVRGRLVIGAVPHGRRVTNQNENTKE